MLIAFRKSDQIAQILDPTCGFKLTEQLIEHRRDPLTGDLSIVLPGRQNYVKHFFETDVQFLSDYAEETKKGCPFCLPSVLTSTPEFPTELVSEGRIREGDAVTFPSLFAHIEYNAVTALTPNHLLKLDEFTPELLKNGIRASLKYINKVHSRNPDVKYAALVLNYLPPAGSTVVHPHMQALASSIPIQRLIELLDASLAYFGESRSNYWMDIIEIEKKTGERYIAKTGTCQWLVPFSPKGFYEINGILPEKKNLLDLTEDDVLSLADGLSRILRYYKDNGAWSFNVAIYSGPLGAKSEHFSVNLKIVARYGFRSKWVNDRWALPFLLNESEVFEAPEALTPIIRHYFL